MRHYYATGNGGGGTNIYAFVSQKERDHFVAWNTGYAQRQAVTKKIAAQNYSHATLLIDGQMVADGYGPTQIHLS